uniref:Uncharacterized protein n=1 Tax=Globisporangium ultimum (strain ATCC 200006 / CBS 805.95 / DAOM BR144) TaxID=431595 RepID=K3WV22_GLOUD
MKATTCAIWTKCLRKTKRFQLKPKDTKIVGAVVKDMNMVAGDMDMVAGDMDMVAGDMDMVAGDMDMVAGDMDIMVAGDMDIMVAGVEDAGVNQVCCATWGDFVSRERFECGSG